MADGQRLQIFPDPCQDPPQAGLPQGVDGLLPIHLQEPRAELPGGPLPHLDHVLTAVAILRDRLVPPQGLGVAGVEGLVEEAHLGARVVDVVFPLHVVAGG